MGRIVKAVLNTSLQGDEARKTKERWEDGFEDRINKTPLSSESGEETEGGDNKQ